jgi:hypothetical protein
MTRQIQSAIDKEVYDRLEMLVAPPISDANPASRPCCIAMEAPT